MPHHLTRIMNAERTDSGDKLRHGPCAKQYNDLEDCAADKKVRSHGVSPDRRARLSRPRWKKSFNVTHDFALVSILSIVCLFFWAGKDGSLSETDRRSDSVHEKESSIFPFQVGVTEIVDGVRIDAQ